jgi:hypothetical protein
MFNFLDDIHSQALSDSRDLILRIDSCINWGVSAVLLPELHCSHFMGSIIPLMMRLSLIQRMIEVCNVNWGGYYPGGRRSISARSERVQSKVNEMIYPANNVADSNAGIKDEDSGSSLSDDEDDNSFDSKGGDYGDPNNGDSDDSADGNKGKHSNTSDMAIHAVDSGIDDWSVLDSHTTDSYSVDLLNSD